METVDVRFNELVTSLEHVQRTPLDLLPVDQVDDIVHGILDQEADQRPVGVARFGSAI